MECTSRRGYLHSRVNWNQIRVDKDPPDRSLEAKTMSQTSKIQRAFSGTRLRIQSGKGGTALGGSWTSSSVR